MPDNLWTAFKKHHPKAVEVIIEEVKPVKTEPVKIDPVKVEIKPLNEPIRIEPPKMDVKPEPKVEPKPEPKPEPKAKSEPKVEPMIEAPKVDPVITEKTASFNELEKLKEEKIENTRVKRRRPAQGKHR